MRESGPGKAPDKLQTRLLPWMIVVAILGMWTMTTIHPKQITTSQTVPYTSFIVQIRLGNVSKVSIQGDQIAGQFVHPVKAEVAFQTTFPQAIGDPNLIPLLESHHVSLDVSPPPSPWLSSILGWLPLLLLFGYILWMMRRAQVPPNTSGFGKAKPQRYNSEQLRVTFADVADANEAKAELQEEVDFLKNPLKYHTLGARIPKGVLLVGPPGTGKTLLARAIAGEAGVPFFSLSASEFVEMYVGVGASRVRDLFKQAKEAAPAIIFIDEIDAVGRRRGAGVGTVNDEREQTLNQLLGELDGFDRRTNIIVLAATNRPDVLDPALLRPGRFDRQVTVPIPDRAGREGILRIHTHNLRLAEDIDLATLATATIGMSGADLENLSNEAALGAARHSHARVTMADFEEALDKVRLGAAHPQLIDPDDRRIVAYHESGHAIVAWLTAGADPVHKVTIVPHGQALGLTEQLPARERRNFSEEYLRNRLAVMLGGRTAEELVFHEVTTGAQDDLVQATSLARQMVTAWGMGSLGLAAFKFGEQQPFLGYELTQARDYSEATAAVVDRDVQRLLEDAHEKAFRRLSGAQAQLKDLAELLLAEETVSAGVLQNLLGDRPKLEREPAHDAALTV